MTRYSRPEEVLAVIKDPVPNKKYCHKQMHTELDHYGIDIPTDVRNLLLPQGTP